MREGHPGSSSTAPPLFRSGYSVLKIRSSQEDDRSVYSFFEAATPISSLFFAVLILLKTDRMPLLASIVGAYIVVNILLSRLISRRAPLHTQALEITKCSFNLLYIGIAILWVGPGSYLWLLHFLSITRSMMAFRKRWLRLSMVLALGLSSGLAEAVAGAGAEGTLEPIIILLAPGLLTDILFRFLDKKLHQERGERIRAENALRLSGRMEAVGSLAAGIAHEINTPVQYVNDSLVFVRDGIRDLFRLRQHYYRMGQLALEEDHEALMRQNRALQELEAVVDAPYLLYRIPLALERMEEGLERVSGIVRSVQRISHPGTGSRQLEDLNESIRATVRVTASAWQDVAEVKLDLGELPPVECNLGELHQVFLNLLVNSADAIREKRSANFKGYITIKTSQVGDNAEISFADNGCGIAAGNLDRVFDPFYTTKEMGSGTGKGLAMAQTVICDYHGGTIAIESTVGEGTEVRIQLPIRQDREGDGA